jgi:hypothetical protein
VGEIVRSRHRGFVWRVAAGGLFSLLLACGPAFADGDGGGFFGKLLNSIQQAAAKAAWDGVDPAVQNCMVGRYNLNPADLAANGIGPMDPSVSQDVESCQQIVAQQGDGQAGQQDPAAQLQELTAKYGPKAAKKIASGNIDIGFNEEEVTAAWGNPDDRQQGPKGKEIWVYGKDSVTFTRGKVSAVGH